MFRWQTIVKALVASNMLVFTSFFLRHSMILYAENYKEDSFHSSMKQYSYQKSSTSKHKETAASSPLIVSYRSLANCTKPTFVPSLVGSCWYNCDNADDCKEKVAYHEWEDLVARGRATRHCFPNQHLIGIRKCGTTDLAKWFQYHSPIHFVTVKGMPIGSTFRCPDSTITDLAPDYNPVKQKWFNYSPGNLMWSRIDSQNTTHITIRSMIQYLGFMNEPNSRYLLALRNPTDRLISYLFHAHKKKWIYSKIDAKGFKASFIHNMVSELVKELKQCLNLKGELACILLADSRDGNLKAAIRHGLYIVYILELFKFVPRQQVYINHLDEYAMNQTYHSEKIMNFFGEKITWTENAIMTAKKTRNCGTKIKVDDKTIQLLDELYQPYNRRLAMYLGDLKWLFDRSLFAQPKNTFCG